MFSDLPRKITCFLATIRRRQARANSLSSLSPSFKQSALKTILWQTSTVSSVAREGRENLFGFSPEPADCATEASMTIHLFLGMLLGGKGSGFYSVKIFVIGIGLHYAEVLRPVAVST